MRCVIYIAVVLLFSPWIVLVGAKKAMAVIEGSGQLTGDGSKTQLPARTSEEAFEEFARTEAQRQAAVVKRLERDAAERQAATLRLIEKQAADRQARMMQKIRREASTRQAAMMTKAQLKAGWKASTSHIGNGSLTRNCCQTLVRDRMGNAMNAMPRRQSGKTMETDMVHPSQ